MRKLNLVLIVTLTMLAVACGKSGGNGGGSGDEEVGFNGAYAGIGTFLTNLRIVDLGSNTPPVEADCVGDIDVVVDDEAVDTISGEGDCALPANFVTYTFVAEFIDDTNFEGEITLVLNGGNHVLDIEGSIEDDIVSATFAGRTPVVGNLVADWDGEFEAELTDE